MSILSTIFSKIFPSSHAAQPEVAASTSAPAATAGAAPVAVPTAQAVPPVDVTQVLDGLAARAPQKLNWKTSIVDLLTLLGLDSSLAHRKELAHELGYGGDTADSATMNIWLHRQVMNKLAANGGKVPAELKD